MGVPPHLFGFFNSTVAFLVTLLTIASNKASQRRPHPLQRSQLLLFYYAAAPTLCLCAPCNRRCRYTFFFPASRRPYSRRCRCTFFSYTCRHPCSPYKRCCRYAPSSPLRRAATVLSISNTVVRPLLSCVMSRVLNEEAGPLLSYERDARAGRSVVEDDNAREEEATTALRREEEGGSATDGYAVFYYDY
ncbi:hypothetical protein HN51_063822 [Arachis hypogaea]